VIVQELFCVFGTAFFANLVVSRLCLNGIGSFAVHNVSICTAKLFLKGLTNKRHLSDARLRLNPRAFSSEQAIGRTSNN
jgi:hypothetical protein